MSYGHGKVWLSSHFCTWASHSATCSACSACKLSVKAESAWWWTTAWGRARDIFRRSEEASFISWMSPQDYVITHTMQLSFTSWCGYRNHQECPTVHQAPSWKQTWQYHWAQTSSVQCLHHLFTLLLKRNWMRMGPGIWWHDRGDGILAQRTSLRSMEINGATPAWWGHLFK